MSNWREAKSLLTLLSQVNARWPLRSKDSDGQIGDQSHSERHSDHNPVNGVVHALDITHDPARFDSYAFADMILKNQDTRLSYVISNHRIGSGPHGVNPGIWRKYSGANPHDHHCHISVVGGPAADDEHSWDIGGYQSGLPATALHVVPPPTIKIGAHNETVKKMQSLLGCTVTGDYAPRSETEYALRLYQVRHNVPGGPDGVCGPQTWKLLDPIIAA